MSPDEVFYSLFAMFAAAFLLGGWFELEMLKRQEARMHRGNEAFRQAMKNAAPGDKTDVRI